MDITIQPTLKQHQVYQALSNPGITDVFFGGGAGGGKSWLMCESRLINALRFPGYRSFIAREELKRLMQSTYVTWTKVCRHHKIPDTIWRLNGQYNFIEFDNGSRIDLLDAAFKPTDPLYERFGSLEYTDGGIEEAGEIHALFRDVVKSRIGRHNNKEFNLRPVTLINGNPKKNWTYTEFYKPWKNKTLPSNKVFIQALYNDNEHTAQEYGLQLAQLSDIRLKQRLMMGNWEYDDDPNALIDYDSITDIFTNTVDDGEKYISADIARYGQDKTVVFLWRGLKVIKIFTYTKQGVDQTIEKLKQVATDNQVPYSHIVVDEDGIGGGVVDGMRGIRGFIANSSPIDPQSSLIEQNYRNLKTQCYYLMADYINAHKIAVNTEDITIKDLLIEELEQVKSKDPDKDTKVQIIPKDEVKEVLGRSPDYSDTLMMRMIFELKKPSSEITFQWKPNFKK
jgi:hypothetical protein